MTDDNEIDVGAFDSLTGASGSLRVARARALRAAFGLTNASLWGERGVGKETFARAIARTRGGGFAHFRATLLSRERLEALLSGGSELTFQTLYLSEADALPRALQRRLTLAAREGSFGFQLLLGATGRFSELRSSGRLDAEFGALLSSFPIALPPLRSRSGEFRALARRFFEEASERFGAWRDPLTEAELDALERREWRENLDELREATTRIVETNAFPVGDAPTDEAPPPREVARVEAVEPLESFEEGTRFLTLDEAQRRHIEEALRRAKGAVEGKRGAAQLLGINPFTLRSRMKKLGIDWTRFRESAAHEDGVDDL